MINDSAQANVNIQGLNCLKAFPLHSCFAASQPMKMRLKVSLRNTETGTCQQSAQNCRSASNVKTHEPYHRLRATHNKREGCIDKMEGKGQSVSHESDSAEKGIYTPNPSLWISITLVTWSEASTIWHVWKWNVLLNFSQSFFSCLPSKWGKHKVAHTISLFLVT